MRYVEARIDEYTREEAYRLFVTESLRLAPQNKYLNKSYINIVNPAKQETKSGEEIALDIVQRAGLKFKEV